MSSLLFTAVSQIPVDMQQEAKEILNAMLTSRDIIGWDNKLQLIIDGRVLPKTNVAELVYMFYIHTMIVFQILEVSRSLFKD